MARGLSDYIDSLTGNVMSKALTQALPIHVSWLSPFPDFLSFVVLNLVSRKYYTSHHHWDEYGTRFVGKVGAHDMTLWTEAAVSALDRSPQRRSVM